MIPGKNRSIEPDKEPHLGQMFHKAGYKTGIFGKSQPLKTSTINTDQTEAERAERRKMAWQWKVNNYENPREFLKSDGAEKKLFMDVGNYTIVDSEVEKYDYDYSFTVGKILTLFTTFCILLFIKLINFKEIRVASQTVTSKTASKSKNSASGLFNVNIPKAQGLKMH